MGSAFSGDDGEGSAGDVDDVPDVDGPADVEPDDVDDDGSSLSCFGGLHPTDVNVVKLMAKAKVVTRHRRVEVGARRCMLFPQKKIGRKKAEARPAESGK